jgi:hypothetical protein
MVPRELFGPAVPANRPALLQTGREKVASSCDLLPPSFLRISGRRPGFPSALHRDTESAQGRYIGIRYPSCRRSRERTSTASRKPHGFSGGHPSASARCSTPANYRGSTRARSRTPRGRFTEARSTHAGTGAEARVTRTAFKTLRFAAQLRHGAVWNGRSLAGSRPSSVSGNLTCACTRISDYGMRYLQPEVQSVGTKGVGRFPLQI